MKRFPTILLAVATAIAVAAMVWRTSEWRDLRARRAATFATAQLTQSGIAVLRDLERERPEVLEQKAPTQDLVGRVREVMAKAGLPSDALLRVDPEEDRVGSQGAWEGALYRTQAVRLELREVDPTQLLEFLVRWSDEEPVWHPARLELHHEQGTDQSLYRVSLLVRSTYLCADGEGGA